MHLMYTVDSDGKRIYTLKKVQGSEVTKSAHPARFSPDDKYSRYDNSYHVKFFLSQNISEDVGSQYLFRHRVTLKKRYGLLITQQSRSSVVGWPFAQQNLTDW